MSTKMSFDFWRKDLNTIPKRWGAILRSNIPGFCHDVVFHVGDTKQQISCHKFILSVSSPVFQAMFSESCSAGSEKNLPIAIPDLDFIAFQNLIEYAYTGTMNIAVQDALATMFAADKYDIPELTEYCSNLLSKNLSFENAVTIYQSSVLLDDYKLMNDSTEFLISNFMEILNSPELLQFSSETFCKFIQMDETNISLEVELFKAALRWANNKCEQMEIEVTPENMALILIDVIEHIRFPLMTADDFAIHVELTGILSDKDCCSLYKYFSLTDKNRHLVEKFLFNTAPRTKSATIMLWNSDIQSLSRISNPKSTNARQDEFAKQIPKSDNVSNFNDEKIRKIKILRKMKYYHTLNVDSPISPGSYPGSNPGSYPGSYQESVQIGFQSGKTESISLKSIGFVGSHDGKEKVIVCVSLADFNVNNPSEEATIEVVPRQGEIFYATFKNPIKVERPSTKVWNFFFEYLEGSPTILSEYGPVVKTFESEDIVSVLHTGGHRIIAALKFII